MHRLADARTMLHSTQPAVMDMLDELGGRESAWVYANRFAQCYVLDAAWDSIRDLVPMPHLRRYATQ